jgi:glycosyltransferase involved in cell wall biosynthesis
VRSRDHDVAIYAPFAAPLLTDPPEAATGGAELQATLLARRLARRGLNVAQIVYPHERLPARSAGVTVVQRDRSAVGARGGPVREWQAVWRALHRASARTYVHRSAGPEVLLTASYCRASRCRFIYSSSSIFDFTGTHLARSRRDRFLYGLALRLADAIVVQTLDQERLAGQRGVSAPLTVIPSFVELAPAGLDRKHLLWVGNSNSYKRPQAFIELAREIPEARFVMVLTEGSSHEAIQAADVVQEAETIDNLVVHGGMPRERVLELVSQSVAVVNTSTAEGLPNVVLEAWARAVPVLSLAVDPDGLIGGEGLGLAAGSDWGRFVHGARSLWGDPDGAMTIGRRARELVGERHDPARITEQWIAAARVRA